MKIFCIDDNYGLHNNLRNDALNNGGENGAGGGSKTAERLAADSPVVFLRPDTTLVKSGKPFFAPDDLGRIAGGAELVVRINRLGKSIPVRFASRYWDAVTVGIGFRAIDLEGELRRRGMPWELSTSFDGAAVVGDFVPKEQLPEVGRMSFHLDVNGETVQTGNVLDMRTSIDEAISFVSRWMTVRTGDLLFTGCPAELRDVKVEDTMEGFVGERRVLACKCK